MSRSRFVIGLCVFNIILGMSLEEFQTGYAAQPQKKSTGAHHRQKKPNLPLLLTEIEKKYTQSSTLSADFSQLNFDAVLSQQKKSSGKIYVKRPSQIRWETLKPDENLLIGNGNHYWFYTPPFDQGERGQLIEKNTSPVQSKLASSLLSGSFSIAGDIMKSIEQKDASTFQFVPRHGTAGTVERATIQIDLGQKLIQKVILEHKGGNRSEITLSKIELGQPLVDSLFVFVAPPNTDRVGEN